MDHRLLLAKSATLLYRESLLPERSDSSVDLVRTVLENVKVSEIGIGINTDRDIVIALKSTILEMCGNPPDHEYDRSEFMQRIRLNCVNDDKLYEAIRSSIESDITDASLKRSIVNIRYSINNHFKEQTVGDILKRASMKFNYERDSIKDINQFMAEIIAQLEPMHMNSGSGKDPAILEEVDIGDDASMDTAYANVRDYANGSRVYKTGWQDIDESLNGGYRVETTVMMALQHKYKTGYSLSTFAQIAQNNKPFTKETNKKPLLLRISFEDSLAQNLQFMYQYLKHDETREYVSVKDVDDKEMARYVKSKLQATGFHVKMIRVDPGQWTYKSLCNKIIELEAQGYKLELLMADYLSKLPTTGCSFTTTGSDYLDLLSRIRQFCAAREIAFITPWQLSTAAKAFLESSSPDQFVKDIAERGMTEHTKGLDRVYDLGIIIHKFIHNKEHYLAVYKEKHRGQVTDEELKYNLFKFPKAMPIPSDVGREKVTFRKLRTAPSNASSDLFTSI